MVQTRATIRCGACRKPVLLPPNANDHFMIVCSGCGRSDRLKDVVRSAQEHLHDRFAKELGDRLARSTARNRCVKFVPARIPSRSYRWITG
jgi:hypothetical protein